MQNADAYSVKPIFCQTQCYRLPLSGRQIKIVKMNKEQTNKLLSMYREFDQRETMRHFMPVEWNGKKWCAATEGYHFILIPENDENKLEEPPCKTVDIATVVPEFNCITEISISNLKSTFESIPMVNKEITEECEACEGDKKFEHYGEWYDCKTCDEKGVVGIGKFENVKDPNTAIKIGLATFVSRFIKTLINVIDYTNCQRLEIRYQKETGVTIFELGNQILIGIASKYELYDNENVVTVA